MGHCPGVAAPSPWPGGPRARGGGGGRPGPPPRPGAPPPAVAVTMRPMKWWGWGDEGVAFTHDDKPDLAPFIEREIGVDITAPPPRPVAFESLDIPEPPLDDDLRAALEAAAGPAHVSTDALDRVLHAR